MKRIFTSLFVAAMLLTAFAVQATSYSANAIVPVPAVVYFQATVQNQKAVLQWTIDQNEAVNYFEVQSSSNGEDFKTIGIVFTYDKADRAQYAFKEKATAKPVFYRLKMEHKSAVEQYSQTIVLNPEKHMPETSGIVLLQNPVTDNIAFTYQLPVEGNCTIALYNAAGINVYRTKRNCRQGTNTITILPDHILPKGIYVLQVLNGRNKSTASLVKE